MRGVRYVVRAAPWLLAVSLTVPVAASAQRSASAADQCYKLAGHADQRKCLEERALQSVKAARDAEAKSKAALEHWTEEPFSRTRSAALFKKASATYERWRTAQCEAVASIAAGGNAARDRRLLCEIELNERRTEDLTAATAELP